MNVDPPSPSESNENLLGQARDAANGATSGPRGQATKTLTDAPTRIPKRIGQYHIKRVIASGGMGTVYEAIQERPRRTVALKLMKHGIASRSALRRFEYESQILARLRHPGIAQVYEAGTHRDDSGTVPFFAMEYIVGAKPITKYVAEKKLAARQKLELFARVCEAIHHGHQKGIIHRDLKPSNILVDAQGQVKIIDFGVARATDSDLAITTLQTDIGQLIGTLQYMSPEQCEADPHNIDTRSDVYALGVVFYELLCGKLPYNVTRVAMHEATRIIREEQPTKLSTLNKTLHGDVETIALKALEKDRERRYQSATDFAQDIQRYLFNEPILARKAGAIYRLRVFTRRNKVACIALAAIFGILLAATAVSRSMYLRAESERKRAVSAERLAEERLDQTEKALAEAESVTNFVSDMLASVDPGEQGKDVTVREVLDVAAQSVNDSFQNRPLVAARLQTTIGRSYQGLGLYYAAEPHFVAAARIYRRQYGAQHRAALGAETELAWALTLQGKFSEAAEPLRKQLELQRRILGEDDEVTLATMSNLATTLTDQGKIAEAEPMQRRVLELFTKRHGDSAPRTLNALNNLVNTLFRLGESVEAERECRRLIDARRKLLGSEHPLTLGSQSMLATVLHEAGRLPQAEELYRSTLDARRRVLGSEHPDTLTTANNLANLLSDAGNVIESAAMHDTVLEIRRRVLGPKHPDTIQSVCNRASVLRDQGRNIEAEEAFREYVSISDKVFGPEHEQTLMLIYNLAETIRDRGALPEAEEMHEDVFERFRRALGADHPNTLETLRGWVTALTRSGEPRIARARLEELLKLLRQRIDDERATPNDLLMYASLLLTCDATDLRDPLTALTYAQEAVELTGGQRADGLDTLALAYWMTDNATQAIEAQKQAVTLLGQANSAMGIAIELQLARFLREEGNEATTPHFVPQFLRRARKHHGDRRADLVLQTADLAVIVHAYGDFDLFGILGQEIYVLCQGRLPEDPPGLGYWVLQHAMRLVDMGRFEQAEHELRAVYEIVHAALGSGCVRTEEARDRLATLYESWDRSEPDKGYDAKAAEWRAKLPLSVDEEGGPSPQP